MMRFERVVPRPARRGMGRLNINRKENVMKTALLATAAAALCLIAFTQSPWSDASPRTPAADPADAVLGTGGFNIFCPVVPGNGIPHETQVTRRLTLLEMLLRQRDVSGWPAELRAERARNLDRLHAYRLQASYPRNYDHPDQLLPCFIDRDGRICAVGYLVEQSVGRSVSERINAHHQYETVAQIHEPELDRWIARSGLTRAEVETIQEPEMWPNELGDRATIVQQGSTVDTMRQRMRPANRRPRFLPLQPAVLESRTAQPEPKSTPAPATEQKPKVE
jgi:hypothetical protein